MKTYGTMMYPSDESEQYIDTSSTRYKLLTRIEKSEGCDLNNQWGESRYTISTKRTEVLPIIDILMYDVGLENQQFGLEVGEVCFS